MVVLVPIINSDPEKEKKVRNLFWVHVNKTFIEDNNNIIISITILYYAIGTYIIINAHTKPKKVEFLSSSFSLWAKETWEV